MISWMKVLFAILVLIGLGGQLLAYHYGIFEGYPIVYIGR